MYDGTFKAPSSWLIAGASSSGKTTKLIEIIKNFKELFVDDTRIQNILYFYKTWQDTFESNFLKNNVREFINEIPSEETIIEKTFYYQKRGGSIVIIDDFMQEINKDIALIFTALTHHKNLVVFFLTQNVFSRTPLFRDISLNSTYIMVFKNPRDGQQISNLARQLKPGNSKFIVQAYREATKQPYTYILFDNHQSTPDILRVRSCILPNEKPMTIWSPKTCK